MRTRLLISCLLCISVVWIISLTIHKTIGLVTPPYIIHNNVDTKKPLTDSPPYCAHEPKTVLIDAGANCGNSYYALLERHPDIESAYLFEVAPRLIFSYLVDLEKEDNRVMLVEAAVSTRDGTETFYLDSRTEPINPDEWRRMYPCDHKASRNPMGASTMMAGTSRSGKPIDVKTVNISKWIHDTICPHDRLILKIDIEGVEYSVLRSLLLSGVGCRVDQYYVEFHSVTQLYGNTERLQPEIKDQASILLHGSQALDRVKLEWMLQGCSDFRKDKTSPLVSLWH